MYYYKWLPCDPWDMPMAEWPGMLAFITQAQAEEAGEVSPHAEAFEQKINQLKRTAKKQ